MPSGPSSHLTFQGPQAICRLYTEYVTRKYREAIVVFDGYEGTSTKDMTHQRRAGGRTGATVTFDEDMPVTMKKDEFLANNTNKQQFINMLIFRRKTVRRFMPQVMLISS